MLAIMAGGKPEQLLGFGSEISNPKSSGHHTGHRRMTTP